MGNDVLTILADPSGDSSLEAIRGILEEKKVPHFTAASIPELVAITEQLVAARNRGFQFIDLVGHAREGVFILSRTDGCSASETRISSCSESYSLLDKLRHCFARPEAGEHWGLRLLGCDVAGASYGSSPFPTDNGTVMQFALSWFLKVPVWAVRGPLFVANFKDASGALRPSAMAQISAANPVQIPDRPTPEDECEIIFANLLELPRERPELQLETAQMPQKDPSDPESWSGLDDSLRVPTFEVTQPRELLDCFALDQPTRMKGLIAWPQEIAVLPRRRDQIRVGLLFGRKMLIAGDGLDGYLAFVARKDRLLELGALEARGQRSIAGCGAPKSDAE